MLSDLLRKVSGINRFYKNIHLNNEICVFYQLVTEHLEASTLPSEQWEESSSWLTQKEQQIKLKFLSEKHRTSLIWANLFISQGESFHWLQSWHFGLYDFDFFPHTWVVKLRKQQTDLTFAISISSLTSLLPTPSPSAETLASLAFTVIFSTADSKSFFNSIPPMISPRSRILRASLNSPPR